MKSWETFYFSAVGASATLIGLMFVALSLAQSLISQVNKEEFKAFATPSILQFSSILFASFAMLIPAFTPSGLGLILLISGIIALVTSSRYVRSLIHSAREHGDFTLADWLSQVIAPTSGYLLILLAGVGFLAGQTYLAFIGVCLAVLGLFVCGIANTWSMVVWVVEQTKQKP